MCERRKAFEASFFQLGRCAFLTWKIWMKNLATLSNVQWPLEWPTTSAQFLGYLMPRISDLKFDLFHGDEIIFAYIYIVSIKLGRCASNWKHNWVLLQQFSVQLDVFLRQFALQLFARPVDEVNLVVVAWIHFSDTISLQILFP